MKIKTAKYVKSFSTIKEFDLKIFPSVAFIGRSNVGKSTLINSILNRKKLVKTSSTPGKTQLINYFLINETFYFIDLPGYGFASVPVEIRKRWSKMIKDFLTQCPELRLIVQLVDARHRPSCDDIEFQRLLQSLEITSLVVANKIDKLRKNQIKNALQTIKNDLNIMTEPIRHSGTEKTGRDEILERIASFLMQS